MKQWLKLALFPGLAVIFLMIAAIWCGEVVMAVLRDGHRPAVIVGILKGAPGRFDLVREVERNVIVTAGDRVRQTRSMTRDAQTGASEFAIADGVFEPEERRDLLFGDVGAIERAGQRLARREGPGGRVTVEISEVAHGFFGLKQRPDHFASDSLEPFVGGKAQVPEFREVTTRLRFECAADGTVTDWDLRQTPEAAAIARERTDFMFAGETWVVEYRPIFAYEADRDQRIGLSDIGRIFGPPKAFPLGGQARVILTGGPRGDPVLLPDLGRGDNKQGLLAWFSAKSEAIFSRWAYAMVLLAFSIGFALIGAVLISLQLWPGRRIEGRDRVAARVATKRVQ